MVIVRTLNAGCHAGELESREGDVVTLTNSRRLWYWDGAASLSELASRGSSKPQNCKFPAPVRRIVLFGALEIIEMSEEAVRALHEVPPWTA